MNVLSVGAVRLPVLMYHGVGPHDKRANAQLHVPSARFAEQLRWLADHGFTGISPRQCAAWLLRGEPLPERPVLLTFDDAYANLMTHAFPELLRHGFSAGVFVITHWLGACSPWTGHPFMTADDVRFWSSQGIEFGAHSRTHPHLTSLADAQLIEETVGSVRDLTTILGHAPVAFAYPYGDHDERVVGAIAGSCAISFTVREGIATRRTDPVRIPRTMVHPDDGPVDMWLRTLIGRDPVWQVRVRAKRVWRAITESPLSGREAERHIIPQDRAQRTSIGIYVPGA